jgi:flagellar basal-body rod modification protein FlgD
MVTSEPQAVSGLFPIAGSLKSSSAAGTQGAAENALDMSAFLTMFTTQLKYQDPTNPLESYELSAQLAQFAAVERLTAMSSDLQDIKTHLASLSNAQMIQMMDKEVIAKSNSVRFKDGHGSAIHYDLPEAAQVVARIYDAQKQPVRTINLGSQGVGSHSISWDGCNDAGQKLTDGQYSCAIEATTAQGQTSQVTSLVRDRVYSFRLDKGTPVLVLGDADGIRVSPADLIEVTGYEEGS